MTREFVQNLAVHRLPAYQPRNIWWRSWSNQAAVAAVLRENGETTEPEVLMIKRSEHPHDPWSGHMAFPGGRKENQDEGVYSTAIRELKEEIGLDILDRGSDYGKLSDIMARPFRWRRRPLIVSPFVFWLERPPGEYTLDPREVADLVWVPLSFLADHANRDTMTWQRGKVKIKLPCYYFQSYRIWGLTLRMLDEMIQIIQPNPIK